MKNFKIKKDKYLKARGGNANIIRMLCSNCKKEILIYQKDGPGWLKRCYLNRILAPEDKAKLQNSIKEVNKLSNLICDCGNVIGTPMVHKDGRLAFKLIKDSFIRQNFQGNNEQISKKFC